MLFEIEDARCGYGAKTVLEHVSFSVDPGEVVCILGENGAGKSTLFKSLLRLIPLQGGRLKGAGEDVAGWSRPKVARSIGYIPQTASLPFAYSVFDAVVMGRTAHVGGFASPGREDERVALEALRMMGIEHLAGRSMLELSGGQKQLAVIARALAQQPRVLVMDEPTAALDFGNQQLVLEQVKALSEAGLAVVMASHFPDHAFLYAHRSVLIKDGGVYAQGPSNEVITEESLRDLYHVEARIVNSHLVSPYSGREIMTCVPIGTVGGLGAAQAMRVAREGEGDRAS